jgi:hypothetical protein
MHVIFTPARDYALWFWWLGIHERGGWVNVGDHERLVSSDTRDLSHHVRMEPLRVAFHSQFTALGSRHKYYG